MGRTEPTFRLLLDRLEAEWREYRRGLTPREQEAFDALFQKARGHASASSNVCRVDPLESVFVSMLLEHELEMRALRNELRELKRGISKPVAELVHAEMGRPQERPQGPTS